MKKNQNQNSNELNRKNRNNWRGIFYYNGKDYRIIVPKANPSMGWTFNFASPYTYIIIIAVVLIIIGAQYL